MALVYSQLVKLPCRWYQRLLDLMPRTFCNCSFRAGETTCLPCSGCPWYAVFHMAGEHGTHV